ncbi:MAG: type II toxin-antitoxin system VapC family toxin [Chloroflexota bacterium]
MSPSSVCIDAGLVVRRVLFPDDHAVQQAWEAWHAGNIQVFAPDLLFYEVTNALYRYQHLGLLSAETINAALEAALSLPLTLVSDFDLHRRAKALAEAYHLPATYDTHYLALAESLPADLYTCDQRLLKTLEPFHIPWVHGLSTQSAG